MSRISDQTFTSPMTPYLEKKKGGGVLPNIREIVNVLSFPVKRRRKGGGQNWGREGVGAIDGRGSEKLTAADKVQGERHVGCSQKSIEREGLLTVVAKGGKKKKPSFDEMGGGGGGGERKKSNPYGTTRRRGKWAVNLEKGRGQERKK